jgi:hypothetical protein
MPDQSTDQQSFSEENPSATNFSLTSSTRGMSRCSTNLGVVGDNNLDRVTPVLRWERGRLSV